MAEIKRDNGNPRLLLRHVPNGARNLKSRSTFRSNDPYAHLLYGKVLKLTARTVGGKTRRPESVCPWPFQLERAAGAAGAAPVPPASR